MQWLFDAILELIHPTDIYVDRGDLAAADFTIVDFTNDGAWHWLDLRAIVPLEATAVKIRTTIRGTAVNKTFSIRPVGHAGGANVFLSTTQVANVFRPEMGTIYPSGVSFVEYRFEDNTINAIYMTINGWWIKRN